MDLLEAGVPYLGCCENLGTHKPIIDRYNTLDPLPRGYKVKYTDAWCMAFVSMCAMLAGQPKKFPYECSCAQAVINLKANGLWNEDDAYVPKRNDLIFYHWGDDRTLDCTAVPKHVGISAGTSNGTIKVLEGNFNDRVAWREIPVNHKYIRGYGMTAGLWDKQPHSYIYDIGCQVINGKWGNNPERAERLIAAGYDYAEIQAVVNLLLERENSVENESTLASVALEVIRGEWGNNPQRKISLINEGYDYDAVMELVNNYYKGGN